MHMRAHNYDERFSELELHSGQEIKYNTFAAIVNSNADR